MVVSDCILLTLFLMFRNVANYAQIRAAQAELGVHWSNPSR